MIAAFIVCAAAVGIAVTYLAIVHACLKNEVVESASGTKATKPKTTQQPQANGLRQVHA